MDRYSAGKRQNYDNVFLSEEAPPGQFLLKAIDHTHCFTWGRDLTGKLSHIDNQQDRGIYGLFPEFRPLLKREILQEAVGRLGEIREEDVRPIVDGIPRCVGCKRCGACCAGVVCRWPGAVPGRYNGKGTLAADGIQIPRLGGAGMGTSKGYYSLVQYCPDLSRMEAANIGVLLFSPDRQFLQAKMTSDNSRIRQFFGSESNDWQRINSFKRARGAAGGEKGVLVSLEDCSGSRHACKRVSLTRHVR